VILVTGHTSISLEDALLSEIEATNQPLQKPKRSVAIRRDGADFVVSFLPEDFIVFRSEDVAALRKVCRTLRWEIVSDTAVGDPPAS
jgi:hypothetical protein